MTRLWTIGFTKKTAEKFFGTLIDQGVKKVVDIRLNNTSQLASFAKSPDLEYFLRAIGGIGYVYDPLFAPEEETMKRYKAKEIGWEDYCLEFAETLKSRNIERHIQEHYRTEDHLCLLCSEDAPDHCHRKLVANKFAELFPELQITHLT